MLHSNSKSGIERKGLNKMTKDDLITVPGCIFEQINDDGVNEEPIIICYYNGTISLDQGDNSINIQPEKLNELFKTIKKHLPDAENWLKKK